MKRLMDILVSFLGLLFLSPVLVVTMFFIWKQDHHSPLYIAPRVGGNGNIFQMIKLRSMVVDADKSPYPEEDDLAKYVFKGTDLTAESPRLNALRCSTKFNGVNPS